MPAAALFDVAGTSRDTGYWHTGARTGAPGHLDSSVLADPPRATPGRG